ncbi:MAG: ABC transporter substrate-binding protein [Candidatus Magasanikbacteria bacterium]|nr:ABC transporter substrate-binding protein [Candidatus Magasanikbacteria bacterium]
MTWRFLWQRLKQKASAPRYKNFNHTLLRNVSARWLPDWRQLRYLKKFLNPKERQIITWVAVVVVTGSLASIIITIQKHLVIGPKPGGVYTEAIVGQPQYLNPVFAPSSDVDSDLVGLIYAGLFARGPSGQIIPALAKSYSVSPDNKTYTIELRSGLTWPDKQPLTSHDIAFTISTIQNPEVGSPLLSSFQDVKVEVIDTARVRFTLPRPFSFFLSALTVGLLPEHLWGEITPANLRLAKLNIEPVGAGPWVVSKISKDETGAVQNYILVRNEAYFGPRPNIEKLNLKFVSDYTEALEAMRNQSVLAVSFPPRLATKKIGNKKIKFYDFTLAQYTALFFNPVKHPLLKNESVRLALSNAINKNFIVSTTLANGGMVAVGPTPPSIPPPAAVNSSSLTYDPAAANALLDKISIRLEPEEYFKLKQAEQKSPSSTASSTAAASSTERALAENAAIRQSMAPNQSFYRQDKTTKAILSLTITTADTPEYRAVAEEIAEYWRAVGIKTNVRFVAPRQLARETIKTRDYEVILYGEILGSDPDLFPFWHSSQSDAPGLNLARYVNKDVDSWLDQARAINDELSRASLYKKIQTQISKDIPAVFLYTPKYLFLAHQDLRGVALDNVLVPSDRYNNISAWYLKTHWTWKW